MKKYAVTIPHVCFVTVNVEAENVEDAKEIAFNEVHLDSYCGNGGNDKIIGVSDSHMSVEPGDDIVYMDGFDVEVEEL